MDIVSILRQITKYEKARLVRPGTRVRTQVELLSSSHIPSSMLFNQVGNSKEELKDYQCRVLVLHREGLRGHLLLYRSMGQSDSMDV